jgi:hypothetical protein
MNLKNIVFIIILLAGLTIRFFNIGDISFGFDQVQILRAADAILVRDFTLIGPRTGPAPMFTGPLVYYFTAGLKAITHSVSAITFLPVLLTIMTGISLIILVKKYLVPPVDKAFMICWALSPLIITFDKIPWNPGLTFLAASLVFFPLQKIGKPNKIDIFFITLGSFLGYQAHFSGFILPIIVLIFCLLLKKSWRLFWFSLSGIGISLLPTIAFDVRHEWLNSKGMFSLVQNQSSTGIFSTITQIGDSLRITAETVGKVIFAHNAYELSLMTGLAILALYILMAIKKKDSSAMGNALWLLIAAGIIGTYKGSKPEYYYFIMLPAICDIIVKVILRLITNTQARLLICMSFLMYSFMISQQSNKQALSLANQQAAISKIAVMRKKQPIKSISLDIKPEHIYGFEYLLSNTALDSSGDKVHVIYPNESVFPADPEGPIGVWLDPRNDEHRNYLTIGNLVIASNKNIRFLQNPYQSTKFEGYPTYSCLIDDRITATQLVLITKKMGNPIYEEVEKKFPVKKEDINKWNSVEAFGIVGIAHKYERQPLLLFIPSEGTTSANQCTNIDFL